jgi:hypothetical protein
MRGYIINECKGAKIKFLNRMIESTGEDSLHRISINNIKKKNSDFLLKQNYHFILQNGMKKKTRLAEEYELVEKFSLENNIPILIRELPVLRRICIDKVDKNTPYKERWFRFSWQSFFMDEGIHPYDPSYDRWGELKQKYNIEVRDWHRYGDYVLICLQLDGDSALNRLIYNDIEYKEYCYQKILEIKKQTDRPILIRNHPLDASVGKFLNNKFEKDNQVSFSNKEDLYEDLDRCWCMITYNSTSCVEAMLYGVPVITLDSSAVTHSLGFDISKIETNHYPDRDCLLKKIAFMQWTGEECSSGYVWKLLKDTMPK